MSDLQAADTVKQQAVQLTSSKSQAASALAAQKATEQVQLKRRNAKCLVCCVEHEPCHKFYTKMDRQGSAQMVMKNRREVYFTSYCIREFMLR